MTFSIKVLSLALQKLKNIFIRNPIIAFYVELIYGSPNLPPNIKVNLKNTMQFLVLNLHLKVSLELLETEVYR